MELSAMRRSLHVPASVRNWADLCDLMTFERLAALLGWNNSLIPASAYYSQNYSGIIGTALIWVRVNIVTPGPISCTVDFSCVWMLAEFTEFRATIINWGEGRYRHAEEAVSACAAHTPISIAQQLVPVPSLAWYWQHVACDWIC